MRQLTAIDALFLAGENDRTQGHVSALGVYDVTTDVVQLFGGAGYTQDFPVERMMRDAKITQI
jgi:hypothetical protein